MTNHPLFHKILKTLRRLEISSEDRLVVALSGGADSVALLNLLKQAQGILGYDLRAITIHHGPHQSTEQFQFREQALRFCQQTCADLGVEIFTNSVQPEKPLVSEQSLRDFRWSQI